MHVLFYCMLYTFKELELILQICLFYQYTYKCKINIEEFYLNIIEQLIHFFQLDQRSLPNLQQTSSCDTNADAIPEFKMFQQQNDSRLQKEEKSSNVKSIYLEYASHFTLIQFAMQDTSKCVGVTLIRIIFSLKFYCGLIIFNLG